MHTKLPTVSFFFKNSSFFVTGFPKNSRNKFLNQEFYGQLLEQAWSKCLFNFSKSCPSGHQGFQKIPKWKEVFIKTDWLLTMITNHFEIPVVQNLETFSFFLFLHWLYDHKIYPFFFKTSAKFRTTKMSETQVHSFHANANIKVKFTSLEKCIHRWKRS